MSDSHVSEVRSGSNQMIFSAVVCLSISIVERECVCGKGEHTNLFKNIRKIIQEEECKVDK